MRILTRLAIAAAFEASITTMDTAGVYGDAYLRRIVAEALSDVCHQVEFTTKVFANHVTATYNGFL